MRRRERHIGRVINNCLGRVHSESHLPYLTSGAPNRYDLNDAGIGASLYREDSLLVTAAVAHKIGTDPDPGLAGVDADGRDLSTRFWLQVVKYW
jgi:hypothetical protein